MKSGRTLEGQLRPLKDRLTDEQLRQRAARTEVRAQISREHAITRGMAVGAINNTVYLRKRVLYLAIAVGTLLVSVGVLGLRVLGLL